MTEQSEADEAKLMEQLHLSQRSDTEPPEDGLLVRSPAVGRHVDGDADDEEVEQELDELKRVEKDEQEREDAMARSTSPAMRSLEQAKRLLDKLPKIKSNTEEFGNRPLPTSTTDLDAADYDKNARMARMTKRRSRQFKEDFARLSQDLRAADANAKKD
eukprot:TRINITY_DN38057_c0_g1_i2.p1 TRINITY_DN38057_c0_g1~~TRINITY_DN38057_c0_g1_i2.p1  ORF type:complete len:159 (-),score=81.18 TRINITY_DN38057_c0_g1_i2:85-561(-)